MSVGPKGARYRSYSISGQHFDYRGTRKSADLAWSLFHAAAQPDPNDHDGARGSEFVVGHECEPRTGVFIDGVQISSVEASKSTLKASPKG